MKSRVLPVVCLAAAFLAPQACEKTPVVTPAPPEGMEVDSSSFVWMRINVKKSTHVKEITVEEDSSYTIVLPDGDPYVYLEPFASGLPAENTVFAFEYKAENPIDKTEFFFVDGEDGLDASHAQSGQGAAAASEWTHYSVRMKSSIREFGWGSAGDYLRFDLGESIVSGSRICLRNLVMRPMNQEEQAAEDQENNAAEEKEKYARMIDDYLQNDYASSVTSVAVGASSVEISGTCSGDGTFFLAEVPPFADIFSMTEVPQEYRHQVSSGNFSVTVDRTASFGGVPYDRLLSKWAVYKDGDGADELVSHALYADPDKIYDAGPCLPRIALRHKKGLGGIVPGNLDAEIQALDLASATINILPMSYMSLTPGGEYTISHDYLGKTYYFNEARIRAELDEPLKIAGKYGVSVAGILLIQNAAQSADPQLGDLLQHPDYSGTLYTMPDMTTPESVNAYAAMIDFFASRYSGSDMRISHWIIHNEVDGGVHWTNMGADVPVSTYMDTYLKSMRMVYNIVHQYDSNAETFISLAHGWTTPAGGGWYSVVDLLGYMNSFSAAEGDFYWAPAYHSYSTEIANPRIWEDPSVTFSMSTANVSMRNLEVLDKWVSDPSNMYKGSIKRRVWLSEAGVGSGTSTTGYDDKLLSDQAAGLAYSWLKIEQLDGIEGLQWHNWYDNASEGAQLGLRKFNDTTWGGEPKPAWYAYRKAGTSGEKAWFEEQGYADTVGEDWGVIHEVTD
ncbi:MAG: hypothetical protein IAB80_02520 [Bacteroidetes bacterium]|uniref:DUF5722 domain-containing protein n=1 Tax=Candidatus Cryptobacteroides excrementipullorum TaxID=2840761 RepID=A0A9D9IT85_9BACT|nr:hypothetical protein [Candidatus Cryptobacteroides excrementipullorum]